MDFNALARAPMRKPVAPRSKSTRTPKGAIGKRCCYCGNAFAASYPLHSPARPSRDHIMCQHLGPAPHGVNNVRLCCVGCNGLRAQLGHSVAALLLLIGKTPGWGIRSRRVLAAEWVRPCS